MIPIHSSPSASTSASSASSVVSSASSSSSAHLSTLNSTQSTNTHNLFSLTQYQQQQQLMPNIKNNRNYFDNLLYSDLVIHTPETMNEFSDLRIKLETLIKLNSKSFNNRSTFSATPQSTTSTLSDLQSSKSSTLINNSKTTVDTTSPNLVQPQTSLKSYLANFDSTPSSSTSYDENFISSLFNLFIGYDFKDKSKNDSFVILYNDLKQTQMIKNPFLVAAKLGHECFKLNIFDISECLLELAINNIDTNSLRLKMATLSTLSACYWKKSKFNQSINCMNLELDMASHLSQDTSYKNLYLGNIYRIYGNLASAYQRLNNQEECLKHFQLQLTISEQINENILIINTTNSIGVVYNKLKQYSKALDYFEKSYSLIQSFTNEIDKIMLKKLNLKQNNLLGDCSLKLGLYEQARIYFLNQLDISSELMYEHQNLKFKSISISESKESPIDDIDQHWYQECQATYNLALLNTKLKNYFESVDYYEKCLSKLQLKSNSTQQVIELNGRVYIGLINNSLHLKDNLRAALYAHSMLDFTLKELNKLVDTDTDKRRFKYLKFLEMSACSKLASCYWKQNRVEDALKLYQREADLAKQMNNTFYLTRAYSHIAQCYFHFKDYDKTISLYKQILNLIEMSLLKKKPDDDEIEFNSDETVTKNVYLARDDRLVQMIYFTLSNIGLCMEMLNKLDDAYLMYEEQFEISKLIKNTKFKANALLNLINLNLNKVKYEPEDRERQHQLIQMLKELFTIYNQLNDLNGRLFTSQSLAYCYHTSSNLNEAIEFYNYNIDLCKANISQLTTDMLKKSMFNLSLCFKMKHDLNRALKYQLDYLDLISGEKYSYLRFKSLGIVSDLMFEIDKSGSNCKQCIELNIERLKIVRNLSTECLVSDSILKNLIDSDNVQNGAKTISLNETSEPKLKLINQCLEAIAKCYYHLENNQQVLKFKLIQLEIKKELESQLSDQFELNELQREKAKLWFEIGNLFLFKFEDTNESYSYFQLALETAIQMKDLILESLTLGNMGLCRQKSGEYEDAIEHFKTQLTVLAKRLHSTSHLIKKPVLITSDNLNEIKELVSIRIDMARSYSQLSKCTELLSLQHNKQALFYENEHEQFLLESFNYLNEYFKECQYLYDNFGKYFLEYIETSLKVKYSQKDENKKDDELELINTIKEMSEHIFIDYDNSMAKLSYFLAAYVSLNDEDFDPNANMERAIDLTERRLKLNDYCSKLVLNQTYWINLNIQINFSLATFYSKNTNTLNESKQICTYIIETFNENHMELDTKTHQTKPIYKDQIYLIETNNLICDISMSEFGYSDYSSVLNKALDSYKLIWDYNDVKNDNNYNRLKNQNILKLKYDSICRVSYLYKKLKMPKECIEILMDSLQRLTLEFQNLQHLTHTEQKKLSNIESNYSLNPKDYFLTQYMEYLFLLHRKIALIHISHAVESNFKHQDLILLALKHVNESLTYLNYHKEFQSNSYIIHLREASIYYLFGKCHRYLNSNEMSLEMFASSLDLYENIVSQLEYNEETILTDKLVSIVLSQQINLINKSRQDMLDLIQYDLDDESEVIYLNRISELYNSIEDLLIKLNKLREALLVTERHRSRLLKNSTELIDLLTFEQIESLVKSQRLNCLIYFSYIKISSKLNCWFIIPERNVLKFNQISVSLFDDLIYLLFSKINMSEEEERTFLLQNIYNLLLKPFEKELLNEIFLLNEKNKTNLFVKPSVCIVYDENMFKLPFHLLKIVSDPFSQVQIDDKYLFEVFEINCAYTLKYLSLNYSLMNSRDTNIPMKVISNESDMEKLFETNNQYDLLVLLVNSENNDISSLNMLVNTLLTRKICKSILLEFNYTMPDNKSSKQELIESESNAKVFLRKLCSKLSNRNGLRPSLIMNCLMSESNKSQQQMLNYLLFGNLYPLNEKNELNRKDSDLNTILEEISQDSDQVTFSLIIIQYLKLNLKFEAALTILNIICTVVNEYLNGKLNELISLDELFQSCVQMHFESSHFVASRLMLKSIGFKFDLNDSGNYVVCLPDKSLIKKISLIYKCLLVLKKFSSEFLVYFYELAVQPAGREFLLYLQNSLTNQPKKEKITLVINTDLYNQNEIFLKELATLIENEKDNVHIEIEAKTLNYIILITVIILSNSNTKQQKIDEKYLHSYIELFFNSLERNELHKLSLEDLDENSSYSTVSSILGIQSNTNIKSKLERVASKQEYEIKIYREINVPNITTEEIANVKKTATNFKNMIQIEIKNELKNKDSKNSNNTINNSTKNSTKYDKYINDLIDFNSTPLTNKQQTNNYAGFNNIMYQQIDDLKPKSNLIKLEQKEYLDQITTITTTVKTCTRDDLIMMFDNNLYDNDFYDNELYSPSMDQINLITPEFNMTTTTTNNNMNNATQLLSRPNINKNVYSCLNNYISDYSII